MVEQPIKSVAAVAAGGPAGRAASAEGRLRWSRLRLPPVVDAALVAAAVVVVLLRAQFGHVGTLLAINPSYIDITVYHDTISAWLVHGQDLYAAKSIYGLTFTYPPFAALALSWTAVVSVHYAAPLLAAAGLVAEALMLAAAWRVARPRWSRSSVTSAALLCLAASPLAEPVTNTFNLGQVNLGLMALVVVDRLVVPRRYRGLLTGVAAAVKLTPALFVLYALARGRWREAALGAGAGAACTLLGFVVLPTDSFHYWTRYLFDSARVGWGLDTRVDNQSLAPVVARLVGVTSPTATTSSKAVYGAAVVVALVLGFLAARAADRRGAWITEAAAVGVAALLVSPVSWTHHWVWVVPLALGLLAEGRTRLAVVAALLIAWVFFDNRLSTYGSLATPVSGLSVQNQIDYGLYVWAGLVVLAYLAVRRPMPPAAGTTTTSAAPVAAAGVPAELAQRS